MSGFAPENIQVLHLELTTRCNAACPQCSRTNPHTNFTVDSELTLARVQELFSVEFVQGLEKVFACGDFGDPAVAKECIPILQWFRSINPQLTLGMHSNGGIRNRAFWHELGTMFTGIKDYVVFSIDGLEDTNHIYRKNVVWSRVMENAAAFIAAGGRAHWDMLAFEHNEHQVDACRQLAKDMGFVWFRCKVSSRFSTMPVAFLSPPKSFAPTPSTPGPVKCQALEEKSLYLAATGRIMPCCFIGNDIYTLDAATDQLLSEPNFVTLEAMLNTEPHRLCQKHCTTYSSVSKLKQQFREETPLNG